MSMYSRNRLAEQPPAVTNHLLFGPGSITRIAQVECSNLHVAAICFDQ